MTAYRTHRQMNARRVPRCAPLSISGTKEAARRVTIVALISSAGMLRQHTQGRVFRAKSFRERSMQFDKQFHGGRSPVVLTGHGDEASRYSTEISALRCRPRRDPARGTPSEHGNPNQLQSRTSGLSEISPIANDGIRGRAPFLVSRQTRSSAAALVKTEHLERSERTHAAVAGWSPSIASFLASLRSRIRCGRDSRLTIAKLRALDDRRLRDIGISRYDIEHLAGRGDRCE